MPLVEGGKCGGDERGGVWCRSCQDIFQLPFSLTPPAPAVSAHASAVPISVATEIATEKRPPSLRGRGRCLVQGCAGTGITALSLSSFALSINRFEAPAHDMNGSKGAGEQMRQ